MHRFIFGLFLKLRKAIFRKKDLWCANEAFKHMLVQRHNKFCGIIIFSWQHRQCIFWVKYLISISIAMTQNYLENSELYTVLLHKEFETLTLHSIFSYILCFTLCYIDLRFILPLTVCTWPYYASALHLCEAACWQLHLNNEPGLQVKAVFFGDRIGIN